MKTKRDKISIPPVLLRSQKQLQYLFKVLPNLPLDEEHPVEVIIREQVKKRKASLNDLMWAGPLHDIAVQGWYRNRQWTEDDWHEGFKAMFLPDPDRADFNPNHVTDPETYRKWDINPITGDRRCVGSTTQLTDEGMREYLLQMEAWAANELMVTFTTKEAPLGRTA